MPISAECACLAISNRLRVLNALPLNRPVAAVALLSPPPALSVPALPAAWQSTAALPAKEKTS